MVELYSRSRRKVRTGCSSLISESDRTIFPPTTMLDARYTNSSLRSSPPPFALVSRSLAAPLYVRRRIKSVMQVKTLEGVNSPYSSSLSCARTLVKDLGLIKGLYKGFGSTVIREVPQYVFYFVGYDNLKRTLQTDTSTPSDIVPIIAGGVSGVLIWMPPFYSFDVIKTRLQVERFSNGGVPEYKGFWDCVRKSYRREGVGVFWRGAGLAQARAFGVHGSIFFLYEKARKNVTMDDSCVLMF